MGVIPDLTLPLLLFPANLFPHLVEWHSGPQPSLVHSFKSEALALLFTACFITTPTPNTYLVPAYSKAKKLICLERGKCGDEKDAGNVDNQRVP